MGANVKQQVARGRDRRVLGADEARERTQRGRARISEQAIPQLAADPDHARQRALGQPEADRPLQSADVGQQLAEAVLGAGVDRQHEEDRGLGERCEDGLRLGWLHDESYSADPRRARSLTIEE